MTHDPLDQLALEMISYYAGDPARIQHFLKVHTLSRLIGRRENLSEQELFRLEAAAYVHDIGIKPALERYGSSAGPYQEELGPAQAEQMLSALDFPSDVIERVCYLVGHHHTYSAIDALDYQILVEADFLVNLFEDHAPRKAAQQALKSIFRTPTGTEICRNMFSLDET